MAKLQHREHGWTHDDLAADLADALAAKSHMVWTDMQLGPHGSARPDVFRLAKSYAKPDPTVYEIKVTVSDLRNDLNAGKSFKYFDFAGRVYFCFPSGMATKHDVPREFGVRTRGPVGWKTLRHAPMREATLDQDAWMKLLIDGVQRERTTQRGMQYAKHRTESASRRRLSESFQEWLQRRELIDWQMEEARARHAKLVEKQEKQHEAAREKVRRAYAELSELFGVPIDSGFAISREIEKVRRQVVPELYEKNLLRSIGALRDNLGRLEGLLENENAPVKEALR